ncbi:uncharacterized protein NEMAJ01_2230 [Nematocida major]|uniref:uncharacterized protein n=1 Tax=Nematocida major TaxID=1912982 RepID=UPI002007E5C0|nr:uncharacterized protein NEMAJ01_2230 [Nematocida major]KAH9387334.1 hypothetical protein NEMAJ01_2230 [Nematocida major]
MKIFWAIFLCVSAVYGSMDIDAWRIRDHVNPSLAMHGIYAVPDYMSRKALMQMYDVGTTAYGVPYGGMSGFNAAYMHGKETAAIRAPMHGLCQGSYMAGAAMSSRMMANMANGYSAGLRSGAGFYPSRVCDRYYSPWM